MLTVVATLKVKPGQEDTLIAGMRKMIAHVKANEPGTVTYLQHRSAADPTKFLVYEVYADHAAFATHGASEPCRDTGHRAHRGLRSADRAATGCRCSGPCS